MHMHTWSLREGIQLAMCTPERDNVLLRLAVAEPPAEPSSSDDDEDASSAAGGSVHPSSSVGSGLDDLQPPPGVSWKKSKAKKKQVSTG